MSSYEALELIKNEYIGKFNDIHEQISEKDYEDAFDLAELVGQAKAYREIISTIMTAKEFML